VEHLVKLPDTDAETFGCFQNFIYTGNVYDRRSGREIPDYPLLMGVWKLGTELKMAPLRTAVLNVMAERRQLTSAIPGTALLKQAWIETEEGSELRKLFIGWAAEHMRSSPEIRNTFAKSLPQEILSELVIVMSDLPPPTTPAYNTPYGPPAPKHALSSNPLDNEQGRPAIKRARHSEAAILNRSADDAFEIKPTIKKPARKSEPAGQKVKKQKGSRSANGPIVMDPDREFAYCRDLIGRMLSGPGFWTRLVGPFREPVDPVVHNAPNYFDVVKRPMDLTTIHSKMARNEYANAQEFEADIRLIFQNCYEYWTQDDSVFKDCEKFEKYFNDKWDERHKWIPPHVKMEVID
ncbi:Bromodomain-containing protein, partial [Halenospora varia]